jgi:hypothetical protein
MVHGASSGRTEPVSPKKRILAVGEAFVKRRAGAGELGLYHHVAHLAPRYNDGFSTLVLPAPLEVDRRRHRLKLPFYAGEQWLSYRTQRNTAPTNLRSSYVA